MERLDTKLHWQIFPYHLGRGVALGGARQGFREEGRKETGRVGGKRVPGGGREEPLDRQDQQWGPGDPVTGPWWGRWSCLSDPTEVPD